MVCVVIPLHSTNMLQVYTLIWLRGPGVLRCSTLDFWFACLRALVCLSSHIKENQNITCKESRTKDMQTKKKQRGAMDIFESSSPV